MRVALLKETNNARHPRIQKSKANLRALDFLNIRDPVSIRDEPLRSRVQENLIPPSDLIEGWEGFLSPGMTRFFNILNNRPQGFIG